MTDQTKRWWIIKRMKILVALISVPLFMIGIAGFTIITSSPGSTGSGEPNIQAIDECESTKEYRDRLTIRLEYKDGIKLNPDKVEGLVDQAVLAAQDLCFAIRSDRPTGTHAEGKKK